MEVHVPGRDYCPDLQDSDRPFGLPDWLWQTGQDPPTPDAPPDCLDQTRQPSRLPVMKFKKQIQINVSLAAAKGNTIHLEAPNTCSPPHSLPVLQLQ